MEKVFEKLDAIEAQNQAKIAEAVEAVKSEVAEQIAALEAKVAEVITGNGCTVIVAMPEFKLLHEDAPFVPPLLTLT